MTQKIYVVTDLGPGDGGKGGVVHAIAHMQRAHTIIKVGGAQGSHGVCTSRGERFAFSQWGCGTLEGIETHLSPRFVAHPSGMLNEAETLWRHAGVYKPFDLLTADECVLCATPYHGIASRLREMALGKNHRGTVGTGVGVAVRAAAERPDLVIRMGDLKYNGLREKLTAIREHQRQALAPIIQGEFLPEDRGDAEHEIDKLDDDGFLDHVVDRFMTVAGQIRIVDADYFRREILSRDGVAVVESSHGVLTDHYTGFHPHTSAIRTLPRLTCDMLREEGFGGQIVNIGVTRAYAIRHGAGPLPTNDPLMVDSLLPGSHKDPNRYQGSVRVGPTDLVLLKYALAACAPITFDGLAITWFDQLQANGVWQWCDRYRDTASSLFTPQGALSVRFGNDANQLGRQAELTQELFRAQPVICSCDIPSDADRDVLFDLCSSMLNEKLGVAVRMVSFGPTEQDKVCK